MIRYYFTTQLESDDLPALPERCPNCGALLLIRYNNERGVAGGGCVDKCGWSFKRSVIDTAALRES